MTELQAMYTNLGRLQCRRERLMAELQVHHVVELISQNASI